MTHGRNAKTRVNSRSKSGRSLLTGVSEKSGKSLENRVARLENTVTILEARIEQMQAEIDRANDVVPAHIMEVIDSIGKKHPGPDRRIDDTELVLNRNNLVNWLEEHWPNIVKPLLKAKTPNAIVTVLTEIAASSDIRPTWQKAVMDHPAELMEFLQSEKFRRKPPKKTVSDALQFVRSEKRDRAANRLPTRQIANAMAGVAKLSWRTSLDKCSKNPFSHNVRHETATYYRAMYRIPEDTT